MAAHLRTQANRPPEACPPPTPLAQHLLNLPRELRDKIYVALFSITRLTFGERLVAGTYVRMKSAPNALALLRTCQQIRTEIHDIWLSHVQFQFEDPTTMMDTLSGLGPTILSKIRYIRVVGDEIGLDVPGNDAPRCTIAFLLRLLPTLRLDTLTVLGAMRLDVESITLSFLIMAASGWKELHYIVRNPCLFAATRGAYIDCIMSRNGWQLLPQWEHMMQVKDGDCSEPYIQIYQSALPNTPGSVLRAQNRVPFKETSSVKRSLFMRHNLVQDSSSGSEARRELLVVVKRGSTADIMAQPTPLNNRPFFTESDIKDGGFLYPYGDMTWPEIKSLHGCQSRCDPGQVATDVYENIDDVVWSTFQERLTLEDMIRRVHQIAENLPDSNSNTLASSA